MCEPTIQQPGFDLSRQQWQQWSLLNCFCSEQGHCGACRRKWRLTDTDLCPCGETQTMSCCKYNLCCHLYTVLGMALNVLAFSIFMIFYDFYDFFCRTGGMSAVFGSEEKMVNIETWRAVHILRGHTGGQNLRLSTELMLCSSAVDLLYYLHSLTGTLDRPRVIAPSKICGHVRSSRRRFGVEPSVVLDLLHPRSACRVVLAGASTPA